MTVSETFRYGMARRTALPFAEAVAQTKDALKTEGFGVLCEIDVTRTLNEKLNVALRPYVILGACNPSLAHKAMEAEPQLGLLLPCNVVVQAEGSGTIVSAVDARAMLGIVGNAELLPIADDVNARLARVLDKVGRAVRQ